VLTFFAIIRIEWRLNRNCALRRLRNVLEITQWGKPPALPEDCPRFDLYDGRREFSVSARRGRFMMKEYQSLSHTDGTASIPCRWYMRTSGITRRKMRYDQMKLAME
jgi:hypothetical protein